MSKLNQLADIFSAIMSLLRSPVFIFYSKIALLTLSVIFIIGIAILLMASNWFKERYFQNLVEIVAYRPYGAKKTFKQWGRVKKRLEKGTESEYKMALIEADGFLIEVLKKMGYKGETANDLLEQVNEKIVPNIQDVRAAHKIRNDLVYSPGQRFDLEQAQKLMAVYEQSFRDLQLL